MFYCFYEFDIFWVLLSTLSPYITASPFFPFSFFLFSQVIFPWDSHSNKELRTFEAFRILFDEEHLSCLIFEQYLTLNLKCLGGSRGYSIRNVMRQERSLVTLVGQGECDIRLGSDASMYSHGRNSLRTPTQLYPSTFYTPRKYPWSQRQQYKVFSLK